MDQFKNIAIGVACGIRDSLVGILAIKDIQSGKHDAQHKHHSNTSQGAQRINILHRILQCCALNGGVFWLSMFLFDNFVLSWLSWLTQVIFGSEPFIWSFIQTPLQYTFGLFWVLPLFLLSRLVNALWFQDIADTAYRGRPRWRKISKFIADTLFSLLVQALFLVQAKLVRFFPIAFIGQLVYMFHISLLYSLYAFEYKWFNMGLDLNHRLELIENNWPYYIGFGLPLCILTTLPQSTFFVSGCIFSILFPLFIISANEARSRSELSKCDLPLRIFRVVVWLSSYILFFMLRRKAR